MCHTKTVSALLTKIIPLARRAQVAVAISISRITKTTKKKFWIAGITKRNTATRTAKQGSMMTTLFTSKIGRKMKLLTAGPTSLAPKQKCTLLAKHVPLKKLTANIVTIISSTNLLARVKT